MKAFGVPIEEAEPLLRTIRTDFILPAFIRAGNGSNVAKLSMAWRPT